MTPLLYLSAYERDRKSYYDALPAERHGRLGDLVYLLP